MSSIEALQSFTNDISAGFNALLEQLATQKKVETDLREKLTKAVSRHNSANSENPSDGSLSAWQDEIVKHLSPSQEEVPPSSLSEFPVEVQQASSAISKLKAGMAASPIRKCPVAQKPIPVNEMAVSTPKPRKCPVAHDVALAYDDMEKDFTTQGKPSSLECPFAQMNRDGALDADGLKDPIAAEFHADTLSAQSLNEARACGKCPIRFLDKHSPEELAEYFENHKHELPRSHEICVKRYQANENQIRQLDAKYGNMISMIQGLGNKHKQYLPSDQQAKSEMSEQKSTEAVEKWADNVDEVSNVADVEAPEQRISRFEKPLRDVRVGESPTRPWGIHVPADQTKAHSAASSKPSSARMSTMSARSKPVVDEHKPAATSSRRSASRTSSRRSRSRRPNQIIFNGPVFLGYSPEQAAQFLNSIGHGRGVS